MAESNSILDPHLADSRWPTAITEYLVDAEQGKIGCPCRLEAFSL